MILKHRFKVTISGFTTNETVALLCSVNEERERERERERENEIRTTRERYNKLGCELAKILQGIYIYI